MSKLSRVSLPARNFDAEISFWLLPGSEKLGHSYRIS